MTTTFPFLGVRAQGFVGTDTLSLLAGLVNTVSPLQGGARRVFHCHCFNLIHF